MSEIQLNEKLLKAYEAKYNANESSPMYWYYENKLAELIKYIKDTDKALNKERQV